MPPSYFRLNCHRPYRPLCDAIFRRLLATWLFLLFLVPLTGVQGSERIVTRQEIFYIPFSVQSADSPQTTTTEVILYVSGDRGGHWEIYQRQPPEAGRFSFRAGADGEFWFAVRTRNGESLGATEESQPNAAELMVVVDRQPPTIKLDVARNIDDQVTARWEITDPELDLASIRLEYRVAANDIWMSPPGDLAAITGQGPSAQHTWSLPGAAEGSKARLTASDRAGNSAVVERESVAGLVPAPTAPTAMSTTPADPIETPNAVAGPSNPLASSDTSIVPTTTWQPPTDPTSLISSAPTQVSPDLLGGTDGTAPWQPSTTSPPPISSGQQVMSKSRKFQLEYEVESGEYGGLHRVEVWFTADNGQTWRHYGDDPDMKSPFLAEMVADGVYGFRLLPQAREGLTVQPPKAGDAPDVWVMVDATLPVARITGVRVGRGNELGQLQISWEATDVHLTERPITLLFGETPQGPWRVLASQLPNTGNYTWQVDDRVPQRVFIRVEVIDAAGNTGADVTRDPVRCDGLAPQGLIRAVRPVQFRGFER